jgi:hypothetical protein
MSKAKQLYVKESVVALKKLLSNRNGRAYCTTYKIS